MKTEELKTLLEKMSLEEKVHQLMQLPGAYYQGNAEITGNMNGDQYTQEEVWEAGSVLGLYGAQALRQLQDAYMARQPHHIPLLFMLDVIHGLRTIFPIPLAQGASFHPALAERCAQAAGEEAAVSGVHVTFAPMADLVRDARWGRCMEAYGEDPYLNGEMTAAVVKGFQGEKLRDVGRIGACVKHFAAYGAPTAGREYNNVELSEHTLREYYLPAYEKGIAAGACMVMTSFNTLNGIPSTGNRWLMRDVLRREMGFDGVLISDWGAVKELIAHGYCEGSEEAARRAMEAGVDIDMASDVYGKSLLRLIREEKMSEELLDQAVYRVLTLKNKLGLFENPYKDGNGTQENIVILSEEKRKLAKEAAIESFVLLKNQDEILPLKKENKVALIGPYTDWKDMHSAWAIAGQGQDAITVSEAAALEKEFVFCSVPVEPILESYQGLSRKNGSDVQWEEALLENRKQTQEQRSAALTAAAQADTVVLLLGEHRLQSGEAASRVDIRLPERQMELFRAVRKVNQNIVTVVFGGRPLDLREISEESKALLLAWLPGTEGGNAIIEVLTGRSEPTGRLPMSLPQCVGQVPVFYSEYQTGRPAAKGEDPVFYSSRYLDCPNEPLYPFGYGLGYTSFEITVPILNRNYMSREEKILASVEIVNTGKRRGSQVLQLYIRDCVASVVRPVKELKGFQKICLNPGERKQITFEITEEMLRFHDEKGRWTSEEGEFQLWISDSCVTGRAVGFTLRG